MVFTKNKQGKITPEHEAEATRLRALWAASEDARAARGVKSQESFGAAYSIGNQAAVGFFLNGKTALSMKAAVGFARGLECQVVDFSPRLAREMEAMASAMAMPTLSTGSRGATPPSVAHDMSQIPHTVAPTTIAWGDLMEGTLPAEFGLVIEDNSMAPDAPAGTLIWFEKRTDARSPDWVLLVDDAGHWYIREYKERRPGHWEAHAVNRDFLPLDSIRDDLRVVAVYIGQRGRRG